MKELLPLAQVGAQFAMSSSNFEVVNVGENQLRISPVSGGNTRVIQFSTLWELMRSGAIQIKYTPPCPTDPNEMGLRSGLTAARLAALNRKLHYVHQLVRKLSEPCSQIQIKPEIPAIAKEIGDQDPPGASTIAAWIKRWLDGGRKDAALLPRLKPTRTVHNAEVPPFFSAFERVLEIVDGDAAQRAKSRERYKFYRDRGYELSSHNL